jgi:hypothetical protein
MMKKFRFNALVVAMLLLSCFTAAANPCDQKNLPDQIQASLTKDYAGWKIVTPSTLETSDRETWLENYSKECPGIIKGKFSGDQAGYVLNLIKRLNGKTFQQVVYFEPDESSFSPVVLFPSTAIKIVTVIKKFAPGNYKSANGGRSHLIKTDTIGISQIDAWTEIYYWDGSRFRTMVSSD